MEGYFILETIVFGPANSVSLSFPQKLHTRRIGVRSRMVALTVNSEKVGRNVQQEEAARLHDGLPSNVSGQLLTDMNATWGKKKGQPRA